MRSGVIALLLLAPFGSAWAGKDGKNVPTPSAAADSDICPPRAWLGVRVKKPDDTVTAALPSLPPGMGFVVRSVEENGPAAAAGIRPDDVLSKLGDQLLFNEAQLSALLRLSKPGDEVHLSGFRAGAPLEVKVRLGEVPKVEKADDDRKFSPVRVVNVADRTAKYAAAEGRALVWREGTVSMARITGPKGEEVFDGEVGNLLSLDGIPEEWRPKIRVLFRALDQTPEEGAAIRRQPRPRVVPPPADVP